MSNDASRSRNKTTADGIAERRQRLEDRRAYYIQRQMELNAQTGDSDRDAAAYYERMAMELIGEAERLAERAHAKRATAILRPPATVRPAAARREAREARDREIMRLVGKGYRNRQVAALVGVSVATISRVVRRRK